MAKDYSQICNDIKAVIAGNPATDRMLIPGDVCMFLGIDKDASLVHFPEIPACSLLTSVIKTAIDNSTSTTTTTTTTTTSTTTTAP